MRITSSHDRSDQSENNELQNAIHIHPLTSSLQIFMALNSCSNSRHVVGGIHECGEGFRGPNEKVAKWAARALSLPSRIRISSSGEDYVVLKSSVILEISCRAIREELTNYLEGDVTTELKTRIESHLARCTRCRVYYDSIRQVIHTLGKAEMIELPAGFSQRLYSRVAKL
jgi:hypothetical protein